VLLCTVAGIVPHPLPEHCYHASFAPFSALLQHVAVFGFNGGIGGASEALRAGTPQVRGAALVHRWRRPDSLASQLITPGRFDQPDNAARMVRLGVAARLDIADFSVRRCAAALDKLRSEPSVRAACAAAAAHFSQPVQTSAAQAAQHVAALV
jgi:rhamnosyltransferase subunit B